MTEQWLSIVEYARTYQVSDMTVRRRIKTGKLHAILQDGKYFIPVAGHDGRAVQMPAPEVREAQIKPAVAAAPRHSPQPAPQHAPTAFQQAAKRPQMHEIGVMKAHPAAHNTFQQPKPQPYRLSPAVDDGEGMVPHDLRRSFSHDEPSLVDSRALLAYCEASLRKVAEGERRTVEKFKGKLEALEAVLAQRDLEIKTLRQQLEDLQLLVKILEKRKQP